MIDYIFICKEAAVEGPNPQLVLYTCRQSIVVKFEFVAVIVMTV